MHWYVVASQKEARIFVKLSGTTQLKLLQSLTNPLGALKRSALIKKQAGRGVKSVGQAGSINYSMPKRHDPHEDAISQFSRDLAHFFEAEKLKRSFDSMTVVAAPHFLGKIKSEMSQDLQHYVTHWIKKDLQKSPPHELIHFLSPTVRPVIGRLAPR